jgi:nicotinate-nucleotide pyrophosphorylase (carboxylating)
MAMTHIDKALQQNIITSVRSALAEDIGAGDLTAALVPPGQQARATVIVRDDAVICGLPWFSEVFSELSSDITIALSVSEGDQVTAGSTICELLGPARPLLTGERTALNFLQTLSATATAANIFAAAVNGTKATILDTRKTLPGLRLAQKYAVRTGGAANHRVGLYDGILIKENHIAASGGINNAVAAAIRHANGVMVEVEVENLDEARAAIDAGAHRLLLDNFSIGDMHAAVAMRDQSNKEVTLEASGGINITTVKEIAEIGLDFISIGALTKDIRATDLSMRFEMI